MERILNSIEELYQLITGTLPEGCVERIPRVNWDMVGGNIQYGVPYWPVCYFMITDTLTHDRVKIEYGKRGMSTLTDGRIYKYV